MESRPFSAQLAGVIQVVIGNHGDAQIIRLRLRVHGSQLIGRQRAGDLAGRQQQGLAGLAVRRGDKAQAFRGHVALNGIVKFAGVDVVDKLGVGGVSDVIDHHAADALQSDEGIGSAVHLTGDDGFRLRSLLAGAVVQTDFVVGAIKVFRKLICGNLLKIAATVVDQGQAIVPDFVDGEGAAAKHIGFALIQTVPLVGVEPDDLFVQRHIAGGRCLSLGLIFKPSPIGAAVALVGGQQVGLAADGRHRNAIGHPDAIDILVVFQLNGIILLQVDFGLAVILEAQRIHARELTGVDIQHGDGVGLLQGDISSIAGDGDVFRLKVGGGLGTFLHQHTVCCQLAPLFVEAVKTHGVDGQTVVAADGYDGHGALGVCGVRAVPGLTLVGSEDGVVVRKGHHVGLYAHGDSGEKRQRAIILAGKQGHDTVCRIVLSLNSHGQLPAIRRNGHGGHVAVCKSVH